MIPTTSTAALGPRPQAEEGTAGEGDPSWMEAGGAKISVTGGAVGLDEGYAATWSWQVPHEADALHRPPAPTVEA